MARGFESKFVADQQEEAENRRPGRAEAGDAGLLFKRRKLELARAAVLNQMESARVEGHREMLRRALAALDKDLAGLG